MKKVKIKDIFHTNAKTIKSSKYDFINYLDTSSITENHINGVQKLYLKADKIPSRAKRLIDKNTIVYSSVRPNLKHYGIIKKPLENMVVSTGFITLDIKDKTQNDANYMYYNLTQNKYTNYLHTIAVNNVSAYPSINPSDLENMEIKIHTDIKEQQKIGRILSSIDDKIAINNQINAILERVAKAIYEYYFVQFDFPNKQGKPYKSSGGAMRFDSTLNRPIPKDFEVKTIENIEKQIITGKTPKTANKEYYNGDIPFITIDDIRQNTFITKTASYLTKLGADTQKTKYLPADSICISCIATVGLVGLTTELAQTNQQINSIICQNDENLYYLYFAIKDYFKFSFGAKMGNITKNMNKGDFSNIFLIYPNNDLLKEYRLIVKPLFDSIKNLTLENQKLKNLRDFLLPLLINAQVQI